MPGFCLVLSSARFYKAVFISRIFDDLKFYIRPDIVSVTLIVIPSIRRITRSRRNFFTRRKGCRNFYGIYARFDNRFVGYRIFKSGNSIGFDVTRFAVSVSVDIILIEVINIT